MKIWIFILLKFVIVLNIIASEYNLDAIIKAKGSNTQQIYQDNITTKEAAKLYNSVSKDYYYKYTLPAQRAARARRDRLKTSTVNVNQASSSSSSSSSGNNSYKCTYMCYNFGGAIGLGHENLKEYTVTISELSASKANKRGYEYAKKSCKKMGYAGVHSRWYKGSIDCKKQ